MRARRSLLVTFPAAVAAVIGFGAGPGCYSATEISVAVTTTVACSPSLVMTTQIFTGAIGTTDFGTAPAAETTECGTAEPRIGTLSIVPSGARDERFDLEVVGAVGVSAADCRDSTLGRDAAAPGAVVPSAKTGCVVARRRVSFRPHKSLTVPVRLSAECVGVPCGVDETCDLGVCTPVAQCTDDGCPREQAQSSVPPGVDAAADGGADGPVGPNVDAAVDADASQPKCTQTPEVVITAQSIVGPLVLAGRDFVYLNGDPVTGATEIRRVPRAGGGTAKVVATAPTLPGGGMYTLASLAAKSTDLAWFEQAANATLVIEGDGGAPDRTPSTPVAHDATSLAFSPVSTLMLGFWRNPSGDTYGFTFQPATHTFLEPPGLDFITGEVDKMLVDDTNDFYGIAGNTLAHYTVSGSTFTPSLAGKISQGLGILEPDFAVLNETVYVAATPPGMTGDRGPGIYRVPRNLIADPYTGVVWIASMPPPQSIATDGQTIFYLVGTAIFRVAPTFPTAAPTHFASTVGSSATRLQVDDDCIYWIENGATIMKRSKQ